MKKKHILVLSIVIVVFLFLTCARSTFRRLSKIEHGESISTPAQLPSYIGTPDSATDISYYYRPSFFTAYEFTVSEAAFRAWIAEYRWPLSDITAPVSVFRYNTHLIQAPEADDFDAWDAYDAKRRATITQGYSYIKTYRNGGGVWVVYDSANNRAYYVRAAR